MIKLIKVSILLLFLNSCSLDTKSGLWTKTEKTKVKINKNIEDISKTKIKLNREFNTNIKIKIDSKLFNSTNFNYLDNNIRRVSFESDLKNKKKYKFSKIKDFNKFEPDLVFDKENVIIFQSKGTIIKFDKNSKLIWKKNHYKKYEKKLNPILFFSSNNKVIIVADNISNYYAINNYSGDLLWKKNNPAPFNSQIKIYKDMFFVTDFNNTLRCFSILDGKELWNYKTDKSLIKSQQKLSIAIQDDKVFFNNSIGDISALSINDGNLLWQRPTQNNLVFENSFLLKNSELVAVKDSILFSNNRNEFYSLDINSGNLRWKQEINSNINPIVINDLIFSVSNDGFLYILRKLDGSILRITNIFDIFKPKKRKKTLTQGFVVTGNKIYLSTNNGYILTIDIESGKTERYIKIDNSKISKPFIVKKFLYVVKDNSIIKLN